jgi:hypothetical protein
MRRGQMQRLAYLAWMLANVRMKRNNVHAYGNAVQSATLAVEFGESVFSNSRQELKLALIGHFLAALLFLIFLEPLASLVGRILRATPQVLICAYEDRLYAELATGLPDFAYFLVLLVLGAPTFLTVGYFTAMLAHRSFVPKNQPHEPDDAEKSDEAGEAVPHASELKKRKDVEKRRRGIHVIVRVAWLLVLGLTMFAVVDGYIRLRTYSSFHQYVTILAPFIDYKEQQRLLSSFASMRSRADYDRLMARVKYLAQANHVPLPTNRLYPLVGVE